MKITNVDYQNNTHTTTFTLVDGNTIDLDKFKEAVEEVTKMINSAINDPDKRNNYKNLADFLHDEDVQKFTWYRNWFKDPENIRNYNIYEL